MKKEVVKSSKGAFYDLKLMTNFVINLGRLLRKSTDKTNRGENCTDVL